MNNDMLIILSLTISGSILTLILFLVKVFFKNRLSKTFFYYIWLLVLIRLIVPIATPVNIVGSIFNTEKPNNNIVVEQYGNSGINETIHTTGSNANFSNPQINSSSSSDLKDIDTHTSFSVWILIKKNLLWIWLTGAIISVSWFITAYIFFTYRIRRFCTQPNREDLLLFEQLCNNKYIRMDYSSLVTTPMLIGVFHPVIVLPPFDYVHNGRDQELMNILSHELTHYRRKDILYKWLTVIITSLHWFNPLMPIIRKEINQACELSCDESVISEMSADEKQFYGNTLIALSADKKLSSRIMASTLCENKKELKERLISIMNYKKKSKWILILTIALSIVLIGCTTTLGVAGNANTNPTIISLPNNKDNSKTIPSSAPDTDSSEQLKSVLAKFTTNQILFFQTFYIQKSQSAAFATVSGGEVWYITDSDAQKLKTGLSFTDDDPTNTTFLWTFDDTTIFKCEDVPGGSSSISYAWYVKNGKPIELSNTGMNLSYIGDGQFTTIGEAFDLDITNGTSTGHTYKPYYLYWAGDGLKEFGGLEITKQQLEKISAAKEIMDVITKSGHVIDKIYYRANNIININYHAGDSDNGTFDNITLEYTNKTVIPVLVNPSSNTSEPEVFSTNNLSDYSYGGTYQAALFPNIATNMDKFTIN